MHIIPKIKYLSNYLWTYRPTFVAAFEARLLTTNTTTKAVIAAKVDVQGVDACISAIVSFPLLPIVCDGDALYPLPRYDTGWSSR
jgi:hypothetical protein